MGAKPTVSNSKFSTFLFPFLRLPVKRKKGLFFFFFSKSPPITSEMRLNMPSFCLEHIFTAE